jgi:hypothetical protein
VKHTSYKSTADLRIEMRAVIPDQLWIGNAGDARNMAQLAERGITAIIDLAAGEAPLVPPRDWVYCRFPLVDGEGNSPELLRLAVDTVAACIAAQMRTLVACSAGMSRSLAVTAAAIAKVRNDSPDRCLAQVAGDGPADIAPRLWLEIRSACFENAQH